MNISTLSFTLMFSLVVGCSKAIESDDDFDDTGSGVAGEEVAPSYCAVAGSISASGDAWLVEGDQYSLYAETTEEEALVMSAILEAAGEALEVWFGAPPTGAGGALMAVEIYSDESRWSQAIRSDGLDVPSGAGGLYHTTTQTAYAHQQPTVYYTRQLMLHEAIHQFHDLAKGEGRNLPGWYSEGHAEHLSLYDWDGECLRLGRLPLLSFDDQPAKAMAAASGLSLDGHMASNETINRPLEWAMFRFFEHANGGVHSEQWFEFLDYMDAGGTDAVGEFQAIFGRSPGSFDGEISSWISGEQQPFTPTYMEWAHADNTTVDGWSEYISYAQLKGRAEQFSARFEPPAGGSWAGGVMVSFDDVSNYTAIVVSSDGRVLSFETDDASTVFWDQGSVPAAVDGGYEISVLHEGSSSTIAINDEPFELPLRFAPSGGLVVNGSSLRFSDISWR